MNPKLSSRELQIAKLIATGYMQKEIAGKLSISPKTIARHCCFIFDKLNIHRNVDLVHYALHNKWIKNKYE